MHRRKVMFTAGALLAIGVAFAAQPTVWGAHARRSAPRTSGQWVPATDSVIAARDEVSSMPPPR